MLGIKLDPGFVLHFLGVLPLKRKETENGKETENLILLWSSVSPYQRSSPQVHTRPKR
jgi:hypothetical protein